MDGDRGLFHHHQNAYEQYYDAPPHQKPAFSHELMGAGAAFAAFKVYEHQQNQNGHPMKHAGAKSALAALAGFEVEKLAEQHHLNHEQKQAAKRHAEEQAMMMYDQRFEREEMGGGYGGGYQGGPQGNFGQGGGPGYGGGGGGYGYGGGQGGGGYNQGGGGYGGGPGGYQGGPQGGYGGGPGYGGGGGGFQQGGYGGGPPQGYPGGGGGGYGNY